MSERIEQIIEVLQVIKALRTNSITTTTRELRIQAVNQVAAHRSIDITTVSDKYRRQLKPRIKNTEGFDIVLDHWLREGSSELKNVLLNYSNSERDRERVRRFFSSAQTLPTPVAEDIDEPSRPTRVKQEVYRIIRDTALAREIKAAQQYKCQLCENGLVLPDGTPYAEAHHVKPLGRPHDGPGIGENIICVCPNCHALVDLGAIKLNPTCLPDIGVDYIVYHNKEIYGRRTWAT